MINKLMAVCLVGMVLTGGLWIVAELVPIPIPKNVVWSTDDLDEVSVLMKEALDELKKRQEVQ